MKAFFQILGVAALACAIGPACGLSLDTPTVNSSAEQSPTEDTPPLMQIEIPQPAKLGKPLQLHWRITNNAKRPVFIYSTLLHNEYFVEFNASVEQKTIEVRFLRLRPWGDRPPPYYFPETEFARIDPGKSIEGRLVSGESFRVVVRDRSVGLKAKEEQITPGIWTIQALVAYGYKGLMPHPPSRMATQLIRL
jgi:hypothetical protein